MSKMVIAVLSIALLSVSGFAQADAHAGLEDQIAKLQQEKSVLFKRLNRAIAHSKSAKKDAATQIEQLQMQNENASADRQRLNLRLNRAIAHSKNAKKEAAMQIEQLQMQNENANADRQRLNLRLNRAIAHSKNAKKDAAMQIEQLQMQNENASADRQRLNLRLNRAIAHSKNAKKEAAAKLENSDADRKRLGLRLNRAIAHSKNAKKDAAMQIEQLTMQNEKISADRRKISRRLDRAIAYSRKARSEMASKMSPAGHDDWAASTSAALQSAFGGEQGTTVTSTSDGTVKVQVGNNGLFSVGGTALSSGGTQLLSTIAQGLSTADASITVVGHTDNIPTGATSRFSSNEALSFARAVSTLQFLRDQGIPTERLSAAGYGDGSPIASNDTAEGRQQNRRVDIILRKQ